MVVNRLLMMHFWVHFETICCVRRTWCSMGFWTLVIEVEIEEKRKSIESELLSVLYFLSVYESTLISLYYDLLRNAIRDMVVRGAPAIAIAAALSLAVEVSTLDDFNGSTDDAVYFLQKKLDYLVSRYFFHYLFLPRY